MLTASPASRTLDRFRRFPTSPMLTTPRWVSRSRNSSTAWAVGQLPVVGGDPLGEAHRRQGRAQLALGVIGEAQGGTLGIRIGQGAAQLPEQLAARRIGPVERPDGDEPLDHLLALADACHEVAHAGIRTNGALALERLA